MSFIQRRLLSQTLFLRSQVGSLPLYISPEVQVSINALSMPRIIRKGRTSLNISQNITVKGPKGELSVEVPDFLHLDKDEKHGRCNKQQVLLFAAKLRKFHPPEPYKGKGIYVNGETIKLKDKKIK
ncbi:XXYS1_4_G0001960.mRNA.1.CDS.1 [Saccharomyces cerevisiae]|nr:XXYS1_4_G0001960.mRNA.1.CDS.1 [Saccharomyces cerevisiae]